MIDKIKDNYKGILATLVAFIIAIVVINVYVDSDSSIEEQPPYEVGQGQTPQ